MLSKFYIPFVVWTSIIFVIIAVPGNYIPKPHGIWEMMSPDKIVHLAMFAPLSFLSAWGVYRTSGRLKLSFIFAAIYGVVYAISTELLQYFVISGRNGNLYDAIADVVGVLLGLLLFYKLHKGQRIKYR